MAHFGRAMRIDKKGAIDLVTEIDLEVEREFRAVIAGRFPDHVVLGEEFSAVRDRDATPEYCWVFDPVDGTTNFAHGLPIFCSSLALEIKSVPAVAAIYDPTRKELFTAERGHGAWLNGTPLRVSSASTLIDSLLCTGFPYNVQRDAEGLVGLFGKFLTVSRAVRRLGSAAIDLGVRRCGAPRRILGARAAPMGRRRGGVDRAGSRRARHRSGGRSLQLAQRQRRGHQRPHPRRHGRGHSGLHPQMNRASGTRREIKRASPACRRNTGDTRAREVFAPTHHSCALAPREARGRQARLRRQAALRFQSPLAFSISPVCQRRPLIVAGRRASAESHQRDAWWLV